MATGAGSAMVVMVKVRIPSAFLDVEDIDAKHMGLIAQSEEEAAEDISEQRRQRQLQQSDCNEFRAVRAEMQKEKAQQAKYEVLFNPLKTEKRALPSFLKVPAEKRRREAQAPGSDDAADAAGGNEAAVPLAAAEPPATAEEAAADPPAKPLPAAGGLGLGSYDSDDDSSGAEDPPPAVAGES